MNSNFHLLFYIRKQKNYKNGLSQSRHNSSFDPDGDSVRILSKQVTKFNQIADRVYKQYIAYIKC